MYTIFYRRLYTDEWEYQRNLFYMEALNIEWEFKKNGYLAYIEKMD